MSMLRRKRSINSYVIEASIAQPKDPLLCEHLLHEFIKYILLARGQMPTTFDLLQRELQVLLAHHVHHHVA